MPNIRKKILKSLLCKNYAIQMINEVIIPCLKHENAKRYQRLDI